MAMFIPCRIRCLLTACIPSAVLLVASHVVESRANPNGWVPDADVIAVLERTIKLPAGATTLEHYNRYYTGVIESGHRKLVATYVGEDGRGKIMVVDSVSALPGILDGGCGVISVEYDVTDHRFLKVLCNGYA